MALTFAIIQESVDTPFIAYHSIKTENIIKDDELFLYSSELPYQALDYALRVKPQINWPFPSCFEPHYESELKCKVFKMKISFHS